MELSKTECTRIARRAFNRDDVDVVSFGLKSASSAARGFIAVSNVLHIRVRVGADVQTLRFFVKLPPGSPFHLDLVRRTRAFHKESQFFLRVFPEIKKYLHGKIFPECYYSNEGITVLEDLTADGYSNAISGGILDRPHVEATLRSLASYHAASFAAELSSNSTFDQTCEDILFVSWFNRSPDHPGHQHLQTGIRALKAVLDKYFGDESEEIRAKAVRAFKNTPDLLVPSTKYRNCLSHNDLWSNNIMFKYRSKSELESFDTKSSSGSKSAKIESTISVSESTNVKSMSRFESSDVKSKSGSDAPKITFESKSVEEASESRWESSKMKSESGSKIYKIESGAGSPQIESESFKVKSESKSPKANSGSGSDSLEVENACLIDMQLFGYNPPAHDVYTLIFLNAVDAEFTKSIPDMVKLYYGHFSERLHQLGLNPDEILSLEDFKKSESESLPLALASAVLFTHFTTLPERYMSEIINNDEMYIKMMHQDRLELVCKSINNVPEYKHRLFAMIKNLLDYLKGELDISI